MTAFSGHCDAPGRGVGMHVCVCVTAPQSACAAQHATANCSSGVEELYPSPSFLASCLSPKGETLNPWAGFSDLHGPGSGLPESRALASPGAWKGCWQRWLRGGSGKDELYEACGPGASQARVKFQAREKRSRRWDMACCTAGRHSDLSAPARARAFSEPLRVTRDASSPPSAP